MTFFNYQKYLQPAEYLRKQLSNWKRLGVLLGLAWVCAAGPARADVWGFIDEKGVAHFSGEKLDSRYELFFRAATTPQIRPDAVPRRLGLPVQPTASIELANAASAPPKLAAYFEVSTGYKAVRHLLRDAAKKNNIDYELLKALIVTESNFDTLAVSPKGATGLMQLMPPTAERYGVRGDPKRGVQHKLIDPKINIAAGSRYLGDLIKMFPGRLDLALAAYNAGEGAVHRYGKQIPPYKETQNYVASILQLYTYLKPPQFAPLQTFAGAPALASSAAPGLQPRVRVELPAPTGKIPGRGNMVPDAALPPAGPAQPAAAEAAPAARPAAGTSTF